MTWDMFVRRSLVGAAVAGLLAAGAWAQNPGDVQQDKKDIRHDRRDLHRDRKGK